MIRPRTTWLLFALCMVVAVAAMGWISLSVLQLERAQQRAAEQAATQETVRLALWRMDSALATLLAEENARPYFAYTSFYPTERAYTRMFNAIEYGDVLIPSPLLTLESPRILLHFQFGPDGVLTSPQAPTGNMRDLAEGQYTTHEKIEAATQRLNDLSRRLNRSTLIAALGTPVTHPQPTRVAMMPPQPSSIKVGKSSMDYQQRAVQQAEVLTQQKLSNVMTNVAAQVDIGEIREGVIQPIWVGDLLVLARRVQINQQDYLQGCWLDWPAIRVWLLDQVQDELPGAALEPVRTTPEQYPVTMLAAIPARLTPGSLMPSPSQTWTPLRLSLAIAWLCVLLAGLAIGAVVNGLVQLSERRGAFVSAVTHELRTPLTTFRMYTDMLSRGMIRDESKQRQYIETLRREADRLGHLVENVLAYARLERGSNGASVEKLAVGPMFDRIHDRLKQRAGDAGMTLETRLPESARNTIVRANAGGVEQILFNLVDNACKYASGGMDKRIEIDATVSKTGVTMRVRDHGPGISADVKTRLFQPFSKSAQAAANSAPGVGLGLALALRYARDMGARLTLDGDCAEGACFVLFLPAG